MGKVSMSPTLNQKIAISYQSMCKSCFSKANFGIQVFVAREVEGKGISNSIKEA